MISFLVLMIAAYLSLFNIMEFEGSKVFLVIVLSIFEFALEGPIIFKPKEKMKVKK